MSDNDESQTTRPNKALPALRQAVRQAAQLHQGNVGKTEVLQPVVCDAGEPKAKMKDDTDRLKATLLDVAAQRQADVERYKRKVARRTQEIRDSGDRWLEKLAQMPRDSAALRKP